MTSFHTFNIDTEHTRRLAHELAAISQASSTPPPELPVDTVLGGFTGTFNTAMENLAARLTQVRADAGAVADSSFRMAREAEDADGALANACGGL
ncbi:hypothetical protein INS43_05290 [Corynebacterium aurimucosum]|uniref:hypothetical protein n=1 Tax=Corynebacterium TaxID=1716 RepID=UPI0008A2C7E0|nr:MULTISPECIES: hypothetical protein [Corynebacterium]MBE7364601.1 hypothetical protein [Corynebacterium aurimucosum]OFK60473.1 hypothetical protein HMPREF2808_06860 [Corynebacterium sp. HMSC078A10]OFL60748.1 hypothetical protein HMPREF2760_09730 [Corynebacterium sp. HMSC065D07]OFM32009.1 hypothetical protein HMPREF2698_09020 [Corynebacterium sp. HMSC072A02]OFN17537.1 hypothetical protein HMPREF2604_08545 [Corynebacterium sp. HMSC055A01]